MPPSDPAQQVMSLTLALEEAVRAEAWEEVDALLTARDRAIDRLLTSPRDPGQTVLEALETADGRIREALIDMRTQVVSDLRHERERESALRAYREQPVSAKRAA